MLYSYIFICLVVLAPILKGYAANCGTYTASDGSQYDLSGLTKPQSVGYQISLGSYTYYFNLCDYFMNSMTDMFCYAPAPVYQVSTTSLCYLLGSLPPVIKDGVNGPATGVSIIYTNEEDKCSFGTIPRIVNIHITCDKTEAVKSIVEASTCNYDIAMTSPAACPKTTPNKGGGGGSGLLITGGELFLILFFVVIVIYLVGGAVFRYKFQDVEPGVNLIPNLGFWTAIPGLVKDGCVFTFQKVKGLVSSN